MRFLPLSASHSLANSPFFWVFFRVFARTLNCTFVFNFLSTFLVAFSKFLLVKVDFASLVVVGIVGFQLDHVPVVLVVVLVNDGVAVVVPDDEEGEGGEDREAGGGADQRERCRGQLGLVFSLSLLLLFATALEGRRPILDASSLLFMSLSLSNPDFGCLAPLYSSFYGATNQRTIW